MTENTCICCGIVIPEGRQICKLCDDGGDSPSAQKPMKYFCIVDDCGWTYHVATDNVTLTESKACMIPHVRKARELTHREYDEWRRAAK